jgi:cytochrome c-type biogenesis protein
MYLTGSTAESELTNNKWHVISRTLGFILGFTIIFVLMGLSATALGRIFIRNKLFFLKLSGWVMVLFGLNMLGLFKFVKIKIPTLIKTPDQINGFFSATLMGMAFGAGWTPCFGPVLASIVFYAGATSTATQGVVLLLVYALGMAVPFILTAVFINAFNRLIEKAEKVIKYIPKISGGILIIFGILILTNQLTALNALFF